MNRLVPLALALLAGIGGSISARGEPETSNGSNEISWPADGRVLNVKDCGARGDGVTDDTDALNAAFAKGCGKMGVVYIPPGTYLVSDRLGGRGTFMRWTFLQGGGRDRTVIKLKDRSPNYQDPTKPLWLLSVLEDKPPCACFSGKAGLCNIAFDIQINDLTLDTGSGNPGAIGLHFICNNTGGIKNVAIRSGDGQGVAGLDMSHPAPGPCLIKGAFIRGFDYGVRVRSGTYHDTFEDVTLEGQRVAGLHNRHHPLSIRRLTSRNRVPAVVNEHEEGQIVLLDAHLTGGTSDTCAIRNSGSLYLRQCRTEGYKAALEHLGQVQPDKIIKEWFSDEWKTLGPSPKRSLGLEIKDTPELPYESLDRWESVGKYADRIKDGDWAPAIQAAVDSGKSTVYFPKSGAQGSGSYTVKSTVVLRGALRVLEGCGSDLLADDQALAGKPAFRVGAGGPDTVFIEKFTWQGKGIHIEHAARTLVVQQCRWQRIRNAPGCSDLFVDGWGGSGTFEVPQKVYVRSLNMESGGNQEKLVNQAADLWILGLKTEGDATNIRNLSRARTEVLGGLIYPAGGSPELRPGFINEGGAMSVITCAFWANKEAFREVVADRVSSIPASPRFWSYTCRPAGTK